MFCFFLIIDFKQGMCLPSALLKINSAECLKADGIVIGVYSYRKMKTVPLLLSSFEKKLYPFNKTWEYLISNNRS